ncbi:MAG: GNAT family N-acetyltransferase [Clostridia bacterium]|nr:GNAT family N-acetyltransferase [Clostridia bacterium]
MKLVQIDEKDERFSQACALYERNFVKEEKRERADLLRVMKHEDYHFCIVVADQLLAVVLFWETEHFIYLEHFAVAENMRKRGYGSAILELLTQRGKRIILEIEPPVDAYRIGRMDFYLKNGFLVNPYFHTQPKYRKEDKSLQLIVLSSQGILTEEEYLSFYAYLKKEVETK